MERLEFYFGTKRSPIIINLKEFKGRKLFDVRKYFYSNESEEPKPTKKGISLNTYQLQEFLHTIKENQDEIKDFFSTDLQIDDSVFNVDVQVTTGRNFELIFENNETTLVIDPKLSKRIGAERFDLFKTMLLNVYLSLVEVIEDPEDIEVILDRLDKKLIRNL